METIRLVTQGEDYELNTGQVCLSLCLTLIAPVSKINLLEEQHDDDSDSDSIDMEEEKD